MADIQEINNRKVHLILPGFGPGTAVFLKSAKALAFDLKLQNRVHFLGSIDDIGNLLSVSDVGLVTSHSEGFGIAVIEYMQFNLPIVSTSLPAIKEILGDSYPFFYCKEDIQGLEIQIKNILQKENIFDFRSHYKKRFDEVLQPNDSMRKYKDYIDKIVNK